jgi:transposase
MIDSAIVRAHQHSAGAKKSHYKQAIGRSVAGLSIKNHVLTDTTGRPIAFHLTGRAAHDLQEAGVLLGKVDASRLLADNACWAKERVIDKLKAKNYIAVIPAKSNVKNKQIYDKQVYKMKHLIENFFARLKQYRAITTRYDKLDTNFLRGVYLAALSSWAI